jgi:fructose-1,6-bisphosphatase/inositol monophosphatase family enzyme
VVDGTDRIRVVREVNDLMRLREVAVQAARAGGREILKAEKRPARVEEKTASDYVTEVDYAAERAIRRLLEKKAPHIAIVGRGVRR